MFTTKTISFSILSLLTISFLFSCEKEECKTCHFEKQMYEGNVMISDKKSQPQLYCDDELEVILNQPEVEDSMLVDQKMIRICMQYFCEDL